MEHSALWYITGGAIYISWYCRVIANSAEQEGVFIPDWPIEKKALLLLTILGAGTLWLPLFLGRIVLGFVKMISGE